MSNYLGRECSNAHMLTWRYNLKKNFECDLCEKKFPASAGAFVCPSDSCKNKLKICSGCYMFENISENIREIPSKSSDSQTDTKQICAEDFTAGFGCEECGGDLPFVSNVSKIYDGSNSFKCEYCFTEGEVPCNLGAFHCFQCDSNLCTKCYSRINEVERTQPKNTLRKQCAKNHSLEWNYNNKADWTCVKCKTPSNKDFSSAYRWKKLLSLILYRKDIAKFG
jgi:hypothetical protein